MLFSPDELLALSDEIKAHPAVAIFAFIVGFLMGALISIIAQIINKIQLENHKQRESEKRELDKKQAEETLESYAKTFSKEIEEKVVEKESLENEKRELQKKFYESVHDPLTGLQNRQMFFDRLTSFIDTQTAYVLICFDVNNLKTANDVYGHKKGDELLKTVTGVISKYLCADNVYRVGGDEFNALLCKENFDPCLLTYIDNNLKEITEEKDDGLVYETAYGYAFHSEAAGASKVIELADARMYENKKAKKDSNPKSRNVRDVHA